MIQGQNFFHARNILKIAPVILAKLRPDSHRKVNCGPSDWLKGSPIVVVRRLPPATLPLAAYPVSDMGTSRDGSQGLRIPAKVFFNEGNFFIVR